MEYPDPLIPGTLLKRYKPAEAIDPTYAAAFEQATAAGVEALCYRCEVNPTGVKVSEQLPIARG